MALLFYSIVVYALFRFIPVTLTLAGIAAFVLSVGMAVDANILIFERTKEELRAGKTLPAAIEAGFNRAWNSILDSNVSSLITATILYYFGTSTIRGFALVLIIGVLISMFTAITLSRMVLRWVVRQPWARQARLYGVREDEFLVTTPRARAREPALVFDIIGKRRWFYALSFGGHGSGRHLHPADAPAGRAPWPPVLDRLHGRDDLGGPLQNGAPTPADVSQVLAEQDLANSRGEHRYTASAGYPADDCGVRGGATYPADPSAGNARSRAMSASLGRQGPITTEVGLISRTTALKCAAIDPSLIRFSMSGRTQYLIVGFKRGARWTRVTCAPARNISSADSAAEFPPPTMTTRWR